MPTLVEDIQRLTGISIQRCGTCEGCDSAVSSALKDALDLSPTELIRKTLDDDRAGVFGSRALWLVSGCRARRVVCEHGIDFARVLAALRRLAIESGTPPAEPEIARLMRTFADQVLTLGRAHHRALVKEIRLRGSKGATEQTQELALLFKGKLRLFPQKVRDIESVRKAFAPSSEQPGAPVGRQGDVSEPLDRPEVSISRQKGEAKELKETFAYYPGCLAGESAREYDASIRWLARTVGVGLEEIDDWNCCGAGVVQDVDPEAGRRLARRNVEITRKESGRVVSGCPNCVARLREETSREAASHVLGVFARADIRAKIAERVKATGEDHPVGSLKVAVFYGCERDFGTAEVLDSPVETLMELAGATVTKWGGLRRCCGGYLLYAKPEIGFRLLEKVFGDFEKSEADAIVTACPHCHFNLDAFQFTLGRMRRRALSVPVLHFTEVLALAMNAEGAERWLDKHITSAFPLVERLVAEEENKRAGKPAKPEIRSPKPD